MLRISIVYQGSKPLSMITDEYTLISDFKQKWLSDPANNLMVRAPEGGVLISKRNVKTLTLEQLDDNAMPVDKAVYSGADLDLAYAIAVDLAQEAQEDTVIATQEVTPDPWLSYTPDNVSSDTVIETQSEEPLVNETQVSESTMDEAQIPEPTVEEVQVVEAIPEETQTGGTMADEIQPTETPVDPNPIPVKAQNFREKFLDRENQADAWENTIIEKMDRRIEKLKSFADVLDGENNYLEDFKAEKLG